MDQITLTSRIAETNFVHTSGKVVRKRYPPHFRYAAVSYHWSNVPKWALETPTYTANVGAFYRTHLDELLKWVNRTLGKFGIQHVWIDAICIDQSDDASKAEQLGEITYLFHDAYCVVAAPWLAHEIGTMSLVDMYYRYTRRCWVVAELSSATSVYYTSWDGERVFSSRNDPQNEGFCPPGIEPKDMTESETGLHFEMSNRIVLLRRNRAFGQFHVDEIVKIALELEATKEKDKLYALMPIAGQRVPRIATQLDLQSCIRHFMSTMSSIDRLRLAMGVSRFRDHSISTSRAWPSGKCPSWSFGNGSNYWSPWADNEYLERGLGSVQLRNNDSLVFTGQYHRCRIHQGVKTPSSQYFACQYSPVLPGSPTTLFYHPQLDREVQHVHLCQFGLDRLRRVVGIIVEDNSQEKIGIFMMATSEPRGWESGELPVR